MENEVNFEKEIRQMVNDCSYGQLISVFSVCLGRLNSTLNVRESQLNMKEESLNVREKRIKEKEEELNQHYRSNWSERQKRLQNTGDGVNLYKEKKTYKVKNGVGLI
jgi:hypothetical protein